MENGKTIQYWLKQIEDETVRKRAVDLVGMMTLKFIKDTNVPKCDHELVTTMIVTEGKFETFEEMVMQFCIITKSENMGYWFMEAKKIDSKESIRSNDEFSKEVLSKLVSEINNDLNLN